MASTPLGPSGLTELLGDASRVRVRNATAVNDLVSIVAVALARHATDGTVATDTEFGLELAAGEQAFFEPQPPTTAIPELVEVLLRVRIDPGSPASINDEGALIDLYVKAEPAGGGATARGFDCGIRSHDGELEADEQLVPDFAHLCAFARAVR